jgi:hypothetical protein
VKVPDAERPPVAENEKFQVVTAWAGAHNKTDAVKSAVAQA